MKRSGLLAAAVAAVVLLSLRQDLGAASPNSTETYKQLNLFGEVFERVRADYVDDVSDNSLVESAINGMLTSLDPHSNYLNTKNFNDMKVQTRGEFGGLGIEVSMENGLVKVVSPIDDTPAARAGLKPGDLITHLDGEPVQGMTLPEAVEKMRGPVSSEIKLTIRREGRDPFDVKLIRATIRIQSVRSHLEGDNIGYIRVTTFNEQTDAGLNNAMKNLKQQAGNKLVGVVLDLRNNPGGLLDQAVAVSDAFLEKGEIVSTRGRRGEDAQRYNARAGDIAGGLPVVVLINGGSASASEIVAGALQDHHRAILLGTRSFGKGSVQTIIPLPGHGAMRLTTARYYTPSGRSIQAKGIDPDIIVEAAKIEKTAEKGEAKPATASDLKRDDAVEGGAEQSSVDPSIMGKPEDYQLTRAVDMLRGIALFNGRVVN
ncbi:MAG TPA: S41 family peptidase [Stellaceae bacterium]|jgi:carboxyl-terminal processing protease|nr:S41 family peptidase [Stellaceae bacterium]